MLHILTLTWNGQDKLVRLKDSLIPALQGIDYVWHIKDNDSKDKTFEIASSWGDKVKIFKYKDNSQNFSAGTNYLFNLANPNDKDLVLLLNNDIVFNDTKSLKNMIKIINSDSSVGVVGCRLLYHNSNVLQHSGIVFNPFNKLPINFRDRHPNCVEAEQDRTFQSVTGAVLLTKAEYYRNSCSQNASGIKGMDEKYQWAFDDVDLCLSIKYNMNKKIVYHGKANIFHESSATLKKNPANMLYLAHNISHFRDKWGKIYSIDQDIYMQDSKYNLYKM